MSSRLSAEAAAHRLTAYPGHFTHYVSEPSNRPTPLNDTRVDYLTPSERHSGHVTAFTSFNHSRKSVNQHHDYSYGRSKPHLRPVVTPEEDDAWHLYEYENRPKNLSLQGRRTFTGIDT